MDCSMKKALKVALYPLGAALSQELAPISNVGKSIGVSENQHARTPVANAGVAVASIRLDPGGEIALEQYGTAMWLRTKAVTKLIARGWSATFNGLGRSRKYPITRIARTQGLSSSNVHSIQTEPDGSVWNGREDQERFLRKKW